MKTPYKLTLSVLFTIFVIHKVSSQSSSVGHIGITPALSWCGYTNNALPFHLEHRGTQSINFLTGGVQRMTINGTSSGATAGFVGIGTTVPSQKLEVLNGNINIQTSTNSYQISAQPVLWHKGNARNIFVGVGAGNNSASSTSNNAYFGYNAGFIGGGISPNENNTFIGAEAGFNNDANDNVAVGYQAAKGLSGQNTVGLTAIGTYAGLLGIQNGETVFVGYKAGRQTLANSNTFVGFTAGENSINGSNNSFFGTSAGKNNANFNNNTFLGSSSGQTSNGGFNTTVGAYSGQSGVGNRNVLLGYFAMQLANSGDENVIIGSNANSSTSGNNYNTMVGTQAGLINTTGAKNTFIGYKTAINQTTGDNNAYLGTNTGNNIATGSNNTFLGGNADATNVSSNLTNASAIGSNAKVTNNNHMILGDNNVNVGIGLSADATGPQNKLEINTAATSVIPGTSGLRFRDLTSGSNSITNPGTGVLSVDVNGDVIYVQGGGGNGLGNICGATSNPLNNPYEIPMNGFNFNYTMPANSQSSFHLGNTVCVPTLGRMNIYNDNLQIATAISSNINSATTSFGVFSNITNAGTGNLISVQGTANSSGTGSTSRGVRGEAVANNGSIAEGVKGIASTNSNCQTNIGVGGLSANGVALSVAGDFDVEVSNSPLNVGVQTDVINGTNASANNFGVQAIVNNMGTANYGGFFAAVGATSNYGIFAQGVGSTSQTPGGPAPLVGNYAGYFNGDVVRTGSDNFTSDANLKQNIDTITNALGIIKKLKPKSYEYKQNSFPSMNLPGGKQYGLIAQDVQTVLPEIVNDNVHPAKVDSLGNVIVPAFNYLSLEYQQLTGIMIKAIQEQQAKIDSLTKKLNAKDSIQDARLTALENAIAQCCSNASARNANINQLDIELSDKDAIVLNQNVPNPFAEQTIITYNVPSSVEKAQLIFFNSNGQVIQTVDIKTRGKGKVNVFAADLSSGLYHYTLVADGKVVDSKKMVRE